MKELPIRAVAALVFSAALLLTVSVTVRGEDGEHRKRRGPPPEAIAACAELAEGSACGFEGRRGDSLTGSCFAPPREDAALACRPAGGRPRDRGERDISDDTQALQEE